MTDTTNQPTIWIVNQAGHNYKKALELIPEARISFLSTGNINPLHFDRMIDTFAQGIIRYVMPGDYLLISGTPPANAIAMLLWMMHFGECKLLLWNAKLRKYKLVTTTNEHINSIIQSYIDKGFHG